MNLIIHKDGSSSIGECLSAEEIHNIRITEEEKRLQMRNAGRFNVINEFKENLKLEGNYATPTIQTVSNNIGSNKERRLD